jgi:mono/diheme cytochrome c family protein
MRLSVAAAAVAFGFLAFTGPAGAQGSADLLKTHKCILCHSVAGVGNKMGKMDGVGSKLKADEMRQWLVDPVAMTKKMKATRKPVMTKTALTKEQVDALVAYLETLK